MPKPKMTEPQSLVLINLAAGRNPFDHIRGDSARGGITSTSRSLIAKGWVDRHINITAAGRAAIEEYEDWTK